MCVWVTLTKYRVINTTACIPRAGIWLKLCTVTLVSITQNLMVRRLDRIMFRGFRGVGLGWVVEEELRSDSSPVVDRSEKLTGCPCYTMFTYPLLIFQPMCHVNYAG